MQTRSLSYSISFLFFILLLCICFACKKEDDVAPTDPTEMEEEEEEMEETGEMFEITSLKGTSQKGPYLIGSAITIFELEQDLSPTGKSFAEEIEDNLGSFELNNLSLASSFVELRASGFYYNEVSGENSEAQLNLSALVDLENKESININILTTLEKRRVEYLIANGSTFVEAKKQALSEVLKIFEIDNADISESTLLNIAQTGEGNAILLAISAIIQGNNSVAVVSEIISKISKDIEEDGVLDDALICSQLSTAGSFVNPQTIRENLESWYSTAGSSITIPDFETYLTQFVQNTPCAVESNIVYPVEGFNGLNLLAVENTSFQADGKYSMRAILEKGTSLRVRIVGNNWSREIGQGDTGWMVGDWDAGREDIERGVPFTSARTGSIDFKINLTLPIQGGLYTDEIKFEIYENGSNSPSRTKVIKIEGIDPQPYAWNGLLVSPPSTTGPTDNLLNGRLPSGFSSPSGISIDNKYGFAVYIPQNFEVELLVSGDNFEFPIGGVNQGWEIEQMDPQNNSYRLTASGLGYYEAEINLMENQGCISIDVEILVNGNSESIFNVNNLGSIYLNLNRDGAHGPNILFNGNTMEAGEASLAAEVDFKNKNVIVVLTGTGWSIPTPIENEKWQIESYDPINQSQTFRSTLDEQYFDGENDLKIMIDPFTSNNPPEIKVEILVDIEGCGPQLISRFDVMF